VTILAVVMLAGSMAGSPNGVGVAMPVASLASTPPLSAPKSLGSSLRFHGAFQAGDLATTEIGIASGRAHEGNPIGSSLERRLAMKAGSLVIITAMDYSFRHHPKAQKRFRKITGGLMGAIVLNNLVMILR
jgi:hypothetical protein